ncbi:hypothetical protein JHN52_01185 [Streptomyces sp. MBT97]|uniref:hypothetical protein n=1 Tax=Streptomyces sp. MBT97 TaxID=2800411 RepID=UPI00190CD750|nr:hypothetical protein [Streptomyces sp. MBT97]MBK3631594.1 hypothetical protein [Streptomyces sp. MBT97]
MSMHDRPKALDALLAHVADNLPDEEAATAKARAALAPLEKRIREAKDQERAEIRTTALREAIDVAREEGHRLEQVADIAHARGARSVAYILRKLLAKERPIRQCVNDTDGDGNCAACARNPEAFCRQPLTGRAASLAEADQEQRDEEEAQAHLDLLAEQLPILDLLRRAESYLSALHGSVARHDNLGENLGCAGCQLRDRLRDELHRQARPGSAPS